MDIQAIVGGLMVGAFVGVVIVISILETTSKNKFYKKGQIDALTEKIKIELVTQPDSTKVWKWKK